MRSAMLKNAAAVFWIVVLLLILPCPAANAADDPGLSSRDFIAEYEARSYGADHGLASAEINAIAQTKDGYLWAGTYSGLYRYDGSRFEKISLDERINSVTELYADSRGRLWIGTNDSGLCCYDVADDELIFYTAGDGLASNSIRSLCENDRGDLYVGTVSYMSVIDADSGNIDTHEEWSDLTGVRSMTHDGRGVIAGVTNGGLLFFLKDRTLIETDTLDEDGVYYEAVSADGKGGYLVGTSTTEMIRMRFDGSRIKRLRSISTGDISYFNHIVYDEATSGYFFCAENGLGYVSDEGYVTPLMQDRFDSSVSDAIIDYQGNVWFVSNKQGVLEYSQNPFVNVFVLAGIDSDVVNALLVEGDDLYIGMDSGLEVLDKNTFVRRSYPFLKQFEGVRVRHIASDSKGNVWVSTYGKAGLVKISPDGTTKEFNESVGTMGGRFRYVMELSDGTILAASNLGLTYIENDRVTGVLGENEGLDAPQILTMVEDNNTVIAGTDGAGIYYIKNKKVIGHKGNEDGLDTLVVLRIVPCRGGFIYVTSNALYYDDRVSVTKLDAFPYSNNYDVRVVGGNEAWISSSAGIFIVHLEDLVENGEYRYALLDYSRGFDTTLTANAWNAMLDNNGTLLLCCTDGVRQISTLDYNSFDTSYFIRLGSVTCDDAKISADDDGVYVIPKNARRIQIHASVLNYTLSNPLVRMYLEGAADEGFTVYQNELVPLSYTNLPYGDYTLHVQTIDSTDYSLLREETFKIRKDARLVDLLAFKLTAVALAIFFAGFFVWWFLRTTIINRQYEEIRQARDEAERANSAKSRFLANMSHEIRTPINTIMGMDELILRENASPTVTGYARDIMHASESLLSIVNDILDLSKIESGKMNLVEKEYDTRALIRGLITMILVKSAAKDLTFNTEIDPGLPSRLYGDDGKIRQVLLNLLTNSVKYTEKGSFTLRINAVPGEGDMVRMDYSVSDTGIGIRQEDMDKLFSAFERLDEKRNSGIQGTGLGLDISRQFVALMGGELRCESVYGEGSTFGFSLEQKVIDATPIGEFRIDDETAGSREEYKPVFIAPEAEVLAVDDNIMNLKVLEGLLRPTKVRLTTAMSGRECLEKLAGGHFDIVLLDHMMPEMDGIETLHEIRKTDSETPVIALTANAVGDASEYYLGEGFNGYLSKPVNSGKLEETLAKYIDT
ncbi:MAG: response regulator [Lachnospiraceae bacterium]|nr:response regulator [Lachnospiraceae bacterium]